MSSKVSSMMSEKMSIKNLLFSKALPELVVPFPTSGYTTYPCIDCGDRFVFKSSFEDHVSRKSVKITYMCRHCNTLLVYFNRCNLLSHIRSHAFKTATINVSDLKVEPLPLSHFKFPQQKTIQSAKDSKKETCVECKTLLKPGHLVIQRSKHCMNYMGNTHTCPICLLTLPTLCAMKAHLRLHTKIEPFYCPECGHNLPYKSLHYPYNHHDCEGFKMMRATARYRCPVARCQLIHPNDFKKHMKQNHLKKVYKCPFCVVACFNMGTIQKHLSGHKTDVTSPLTFFQCAGCPGRLVLNNQLEHHLNTHSANNLFVFPCWSCGKAFKKISALIAHHISAQHEKYSAEIIKVLTSMTNNDQADKGIYRVVKKCDKCNRSFTYKCEFNQIRTLPNECPYKCTNDVNINALNTGGITTLICHLCKESMSSDWKEIKKHYAEFHKSIKCLDAKIVLPRCDVTNAHNSKKSLISKLRSRNINVTRTSRKNKAKHVSRASITSPPIKATPTKLGALACKRCNLDFENKELFETHIVTHRDPCTAFQCMECGECFVVKPSFAMHLLLEHDEKNVEEYISSKECFNEKALLKYQSDSAPMEPLRENQCKICRDQFENSEELDKHFRVHGMAFLLRNNSAKNSSP